MNKRESKWIKRRSPGIPGKRERATIIDTLLMNRDIDLSRDEGYDPSSDIEKMKDAVNLATFIAEYTAQGKKIVIYGDYDVDGITSIAIYYKTLKAIGYIVDYYIPDRIDEGYGLNSKAIHHLKESGYDAVITVDCGITSVDEAEFARETGLDLIITDHHECHEVMPSCRFTVNPKQKDCSYPFKGLVAAGITYKICCYILKNYKKPGVDISDVLSEISILAALGTIADVGTLTFENRYIVKEGLKNLSENGYFQIEQFVSRNASSYDIAFKAAPRINAAGRIDRPTLGVEFLISEDESESIKIAGILDKLNAERKSIESLAVEKSRKCLETSDEYLNPIIISHDKNFHSGVIGIVASRLADVYNKPAIVLSEDADKRIFRASARSVAGIDVFNFLNAFSGMFLKFGGHGAAAGFSIKTELFADFRKKVVEEAGKLFDRSLLSATYVYDLELKASDIVFDLINDMKMLEPFGIDNPKPLFSVAKATVDKTVKVGKTGNVGKIALLIENRIFDGVLFTIDRRFDMLKKGDKIDIIFELEKNTFYSITNIRLVLRDYRLSADESGSALAAKLNDFAVSIEEMKSEAIAPVSIDRSYLPGREEMATVYKSLKRTAPHNETVDLIRFSENLDMSAEKIVVAVAIMKNANILDFTIFGLRLSVNFFKIDEKVDILNSPTYVKLENN